ncbi:DUF3159 domain-containing protein [Gudongella sp. DL1XJH-153]|uniref:DUF3159 domain-containing protein n=1 Tax=Gudongella sp. DL1XJH-153 TaxID=3409804 RepID=UPI003BB6DFA2
MKNILYEITDEVKSVIGGKTIGAIVPPIVFVIANNLFGLLWGILAAVLTAVIIGIQRYLMGETIKYAAGGLVGVLLASAFSFYAGNAADYFLPRIISSGFLFLVSIVTIVVGKPIAALASHISRGWEMGWFMRKDVKPAYREVSIVWAMLFLLRMYLQVLLYRGGDLFIMAWANTLLGFPATLTVLILSYVYGTWRLRNLGGPGIDEYREDKTPPWKGQTRGF